jgi:hypothetical protein
MTSLRNRLAKRQEAAPDERGSILILALVFITAVSLVLLALASWTTNDLTNSTNFANARNANYAASGTTTVAINSIRYATLLSAGQAQNTATALSYCWQPSASPAVSQLTTDGVTIAVWCSTVEDLASASTRVVSFYACKSTLTASSSASTISAAATACAASPLLYAQVTYDDYPPGGSTPLTTQCSTWCGQGTTLNSWKWAGSGTAVAPAA